MHAQGLEDARAEQITQRLTSDARQQDTQNQRAGVVLPPFARLMHQRQRAEAPDPLVHGVRRARVWLTEDKLQRIGGFDNRERWIERWIEGRLEQVAEAHAERQQVVERDRATGRDRVVEWTVDPPEDPPVGQLGKPRVDRLIQSQLALFDEHHRRRGEDRLGHRGDAKQRVAAHGLGAAERLEADGVDVHVVTLSDQAHHSGHFAVLDTSRHGGVQTFEA